jgi:hypothetical protein
LWVYKKVKIFIFLVQTNWIQIPHCGSGSESLPKCCLYGMRPYCSFCFSFNFPGSSLLHFVWSCFPAFPDSIFVFYFNIYLFFLCFMYILIFHWFSISFFCHSCVLNSHNLMFCSSNQNCCWKYNCVLFPGYFFIFLGNISFDLCQFGSVQCCGSEPTLFGSGSSSEQDQKEFGSGSYQNFSNFFEMKAVTVVKMLFFTMNIHF